MKSRAVLVGLGCLTAALAISYSTLADPVPGGERETWATRLETHADAADSRKNSLAEAYGIIASKEATSRLNLPGISPLPADPAAVQARDAELDSYAGGQITDERARAIIRRRKYLEELAAEMTRLRDVSGNLVDLAQEIRSAPSDEEALNIVQNAKVPLTTVSIIGQSVIGSGQNAKPVSEAFAETDKAAEELDEERFRKARIATDDRTVAAWIETIEIDGRKASDAAALIATSPHVLARMSLATADYPSVGALMYDFNGQGLKPLCTGTLISEDAFLTAAHCFCDLGSTDPGAKIFTMEKDKYSFRSWASCMAASYKRGDRKKSIRPDNPEGHSVYFQHAGLIEADRIQIYDHYDFGLNQGDLAVVHLKKPVLNVRPARINSDMVFFNNSPGMIVGFGARNITDEKGKPVNEVSYRTVGLKNNAEVRLRPCESGYAGRGLLCWNFLATEGLDVGTSCGGDSGGPLFVDTANGWKDGANPPSKQVAESGDMILMGVISAGPRGGCLASGQSINTDVRVYSPWIKKVVPNAATTETGIQATDDGRLDPVHNDLTKRLAYYDSNGVFGDNAMPEPRYVQVFRLEKVAQLLMVTINGTIGEGHPGSFGLRVANESGFSKDCDYREKHLVYACSLDGQSGRWEIQVFGSRPREFQLVATPQGLPRVVGSSTSQGTGSATLAP